MKCIKDLSTDKLRGTRVLLRLDLNVPISDKGEVLDDFRIRKALPTIKFLQYSGAKIRIISHASSKEASLNPVAEYMTKQLGVLLTFITDIFGHQGQTFMDNQKEGDIIFFENIRNYDGEEANVSEFASQLASLADIYVNDAFSVSHRAHASIIGVPKIIPGYVGEQFVCEVHHLKKAFNAPRPFIFVLGGAKFSTKLPLLRKFSEIADKVVVGGAIANELFEEQGIEVGESLTTKQTDLDQQEILRHPNLYLPSDVVVSSGDDEKKNKKTMDVSREDTIVDIGPNSLKEVQEIIKTAAFVLWNGPFGNYEAGFTQGTEEIAKYISEHNMQSIVGGGDTLAAIKILGIEEKFTFVSTGGGAMLDFLVDETLVGIQALEE